MSRDLLPDTAALLPDEAGGRREDVSAPVEEPDFETLLALHRGFREQAREVAGTAFTSWEQPLPNLTWSRQRIENVKHWLDQGGFDWEVEAALKRKAKTGRIEDEEE
ncbi:hypothetical protein LAZ40_02275 [Cereibacter sphaeroides]|uniref:hypothetical protein n=1 Tax=Cereibacter sphaeroides TaxID=1063 RepID=UPI001F275063|nr:hypothetical protein [Cereibacter sphaeroides]MCE6957884.1 hypothetical protein [Cereibacter sphaeroides]MCE6971853.1 hypothetical protein [Cereibacter sphaeroides]